MKKRSLLLISSIFCVVAFCVLLTGCDESEAPIPEEVIRNNVNTGVVIEYDTNLLMNIYDVRVLVNDSQLGVIEQGEKILYELFLFEGENTITFSEFGNDEIQRQKHLKFLQIVIITSS